MHNTTGDNPDRKTVMNKKSVITVTALVVVLTLGLAGCDDQNVSFPPDTQQKIYITYDLPDGWAWVDKNVGMAILEHPSKDGAIPYVKLEAGIFRKGTEEDAKKEIYDIYLEGKKECDARGTECIAQPIYKEMNIEGTTVYMEMMKDYNNLGTISWGTSFAFVKDGYVSPFALYDKADLYINELTKVIQTLKITTY